MNWQKFKDQFYLKYFPSATRDKMLSQLWALKQGNRSIEDYEVEFHNLVKFAPEGIINDEQMKIQKFRDGLSIELQINVRSSELNSLGELISKVKMMEELRNKLKFQDSPAKVLGKRSFGYFGGKNYEVGS